MPLLLKTKVKVRFDRTVTDRSNLFSAVFLGFNLVSPRVERFLPIIKDPAHLGAALL
jgi:hypothetical protein